jgi:S-adenosylmethionine:tRNA ribosyltransferase-isomerase
LFAKKATGGKAELLLIREIESGLWSVLSSGLKAGKKLVLPDGSGATVEGLNDSGEYLCRFEVADMRGYLERHGSAPLPPYIAKRRRPESSDRALYQTVYAKDSGSIAAPTAGLHFTPELLKRIQDEGVRVAYLTLHVGRGTFQPIQAEDARLHAMQSEWYRLEASDAELISQAKKAGGRIITVGTTSTRVLETLAARPEGFGPGEGWSALYITPGYPLRIVDNLITNFHLPRSSPLMLAAAFLGRELLLSAYRQAVAKRYRFYSYGDAMLIL